MAVTESTTAERQAWLHLLLTVGLVLTLGDIAFLAYMVLSTAPAWMWAYLSLAPWGPLALFTWLLVSRHRQRVAYLNRYGITASSVVTTIDNTTVLNGRAVLRLGVMVQLPDRKQPYPLRVRNAPPPHMAAILRPGVALPLKVDPHNVFRVMIDWKAAEAQVPPAKPTARFL